MTPAVPQMRLDNVATLPRQQVRTGPPVIGESLFRSVLVRERKRADRSNQPFALVVVATEAVVHGNSGPMWRTVIDSLSAVKRETDAVGWLDKGRAIGLLLPEVAASTANFSRDLNERVRYELIKRLDAKALDRVVVKVHVHRAKQAVGVGEPFQAVGSIVPDGASLQERHALAKRILDVVLSAMLLAILAPIFLLLAALVKLSSPGPVFFRQERVGQKMTRFMMLKFRTMRVNADPSIHQQFVSSFIKSGSKATPAATSAAPLFKITNHPRVTTIGRILRRTSLDELPQFWNVLRGEMSLVGPRPPLPYEVEQYQAWHLRRVLEAKPGVTGLWQVTGRSRTTFDEMVRLDLRYAKRTSVWTDIKILLATPLAMISGKGAC
jgi:exopolysaccharide biosynthesis polyprenyl glycosylphosphotransferase